MQQQLISETRQNRRTIATYATYAEAQRAVDHLSDQSFPVQRVAIVADGLKFVEQVTGRLNYGRALLNGAISGALTGAFIGFLFGLFSFFTPLVSAINLALTGLLIGAVIGAIFGLISYALSGGQRDFSSLTTMQADRYHVMADPEVADDAERLLGNLRSTVPA
ncbi:MAG TPA: general stress protein [Herpetosiphonaceae bacterium]